MSDITVQSLPAVTFLHQTGRCPTEEMANALGPALGAVHGYAAQHGIEFLGPPMTLYLAMEPGQITFQAGVAVPEGTRGDGGDIEVMTLPAGRGVVTMHVGPYERLGEAHQAVEAFLKEKGLEVAGPPREVYVTDPGEVEDPEEWQTEVIWPVGG